MNKIATFCTCCAAIVGAIALMPPPAAAQTTKAPVTPSTMAPAAPSTMAPAAPSAMAPSRTTKSTAMAPARPSNQYATEADAKTHCAGDTVVWANLSSKAYHFSTNKNYGKTKRGAYMCRKEGDAAGFHAAKGEKAP